MQKANGNHKDKLAMTEIVKKISFGFYYLTVGLISLFVILSYLSRMNLYFELLCHLRLIFEVVLALLLVASMVLKLNKTSLVVSFVFILNSIPFLPFYFPPQRIQAGAKTSVSVLQCNVRPYQNKDYQKVLDVISMRNPDIVGIIELKKDWTEKLEGLKDDYPYVFKEEGFGGIMILSKFPLIEPAIQYTGEIKRPRIKTAIEKEGKLVSIILAHTVTPKNDLKFRNKELRILAEEADQTNRPLILFGDLNCSPFSYYFDDLLKRGRLSDTACGFGFKGTWPANYLPVIPIDHFLTSDDIFCTERIVGPEIGSDHLPVFVRLTLLE